MDIPNLSQTPVTAPVNNSIPPVKKAPLSLLPFALILLLALATGFWASRFFPVSKNAASKITLPGQEKAISTDDIKDKAEIQVGKVYGDTNSTFKDSATGSVEKGAINGVGTHILNRDGGASQRVSMTSSVVDLDLFVGHKVEIKGQTNSSNKTGWLMDVGTVKVLE